MIKVDHTVTTNITDGITIIDSQMPADILLSFDLFREEASIRGCVFFSETNENNSVRTISFIWGTQTIMDSFVEWCNEREDLDLYAQFTAVIEANGGTLTKTFTEI